MRWPCLITQKRGTSLSGNQNVFLCCSEGTYPSPYDFDGKIMFPSNAGILSSGGYNSPLLWTPPPYPNFTGYTYHGQRVKDVNPFGNRYFLIHKSIQNLNPISPRAVPPTASSPLYDAYGDPGSPWGSSNLCAPRCRAFNITCVLSKVRSPARVFRMIFVAKRQMYMRAVPLGADYTFLCFWGTKGIFFK